jgi:hypothetical protein
MSTKSWTSVAVRGSHIARGAFFEDKDEVCTARTIAETQASHWQDG